MGAPNSVAALSFNAHASGSRRQVPESGEIPMMYVGVDHLRHDLVGKSLARGALARRFGMCSVAAVSAPATQSTTYARSSRTPTATRSLD